MKKIVTILGARPQFVKGAVLSRIFKKNRGVNEIIVHTGQHFDPNMSSVFFEEMDIPQPKYNLNINGLSHGAMTGLMLEKIETILKNEKPNAVVVYGDTNSTLAGALAAKKMGIKVVHIEAGLRSHNMGMPEEINRVCTDRISDLLSCPTDLAVSNLKNEGFDHLPIVIEKHGDIMKDAMCFYSAFSEMKSTLLSELGLKEGAFVLATIHRQENTDSAERLKEIFIGLDDINATKRVVLPLHPRTKKYIDVYDIQTEVTLIEPVGYFDMLELLKNCSMVVTDSGGLQKEAFFNKKPCLIVRDETEWQELVIHDFAAICGADSKKMIREFSKYIKMDVDFNIELYGTHVGEKIVASILKILNE